MKDLGDLKYFLGIEFARLEQGMLMHQRKYALELISGVGTNNKEQDELLPDVRSYQTFIRELLYLTVTRPDIAYNVQTLNWAACPHTRKSTTGLLITFGDSLIFWKSKKQSATFRSPAEAEYRSLASTVEELTWLLGLIKDMGIEVKLPVQ
ncbi:PREDICTED: uncharacterized protein LOC109230350 [Nicotiana attenuata]|uniref:uncharacterized protein LOC109230350 n=1 Tax=Nicotiana attenuata TaxID=49451 RepID=UPI000904A71C|nr:PREDICTED: uncharacterized protein LOC109230350 [Nicotiana attenuata]